MLILPPLSFNRAVWQFRISDSAAARWINLLIADAGETSEEPWTLLLTEEPALAVWSFLASDRLCSSVPKLAAWIAASGLSKIRDHGCKVIHGDEVLRSGCDVANSKFVDNESLRACVTFPQELLPEWIRHIIGKRNPEASTQNVELNWTGLFERLAQAEPIVSDFRERLEQEKLASLKELAYGASHEINNPLANIATRAQVLLRDESNDERRKLLATIASQAFRAHEMISDLMLFAKPPRPRPAPINLVDVVTRITKELQSEADLQSTSLRLVISVTQLEISTDAEQLSVALRAIVNNALQALGRGGEIEITLNSTLDSQSDQPNRGCEISVRDNGPGISDETRRHLFDPFYSGREAGRGLGFGLAKSWRIITSLGGKLSVESLPKMGATFVIQLPIN